MIAFLMYVECQNSNPYERDMNFWKTFSCVRPTLWQPVHRDMRKTDKWEGETHPTSVELMSTCALRTQKLSTINKDPQSLSFHTSHYSLCIISLSIHIIPFLWNGSSLLMESSWAVESRHKGEFTTSLLWVFKSLPRQGDTS